MFFHKHRTLKTQPKRQLGVRNPSIIQLQSDHQSPRLTHFPNLATKKLKKERKRQHSHIASHQQSNQIEDCKNKRTLRLNPKPTRLVKNGQPEVGSF